jgi:RNA recognition motif-containing protein
MFIPFGMVEHSTLLSQLDGAGRRRGFVLMSTHKEAIDAMTAMNGTYIE